MLMAVVVKRRGKPEEFDEKKIYSSVYAAGMECAMDEKSAAALAARMVEEVKRFVHGKAEVNSTEIFGLVVQKLAREHEPVAFTYQTHREMSK